MTYDLDHQSSEVVVGIRSAFSAGLKPGDKIFWLTEFGSIEEFVVLNAWKRAILCQGTGRFTGEWTFKEGYHGLEVFASRIDALRQQRVRFLSKIDSCKRQIEEVRQKLDVVDCQIGKEMRT